MKTGEPWSCWRLLALACLAALSLLGGAGCVKDRAFVEKNLMARPAPGAAATVGECYRVGCPDVIGLEIAQRSEFAGPYEIGTDGRINLGDYGNPRVEGRTLAEVVKLIAEETGVSPESVKVDVAEYRSQHVLLFGEVTGLQRSVPYRGPETVLELLQRVGGITHGAAPNDVYVVRPNVGANRRPEVFHVDLNAIVMRQDHKTNIRVEPFDQVFVGETRRAKIEKAIPPILRGVYRMIPGVRGQGSGDRSQGSGVRSLEADS